MIETIAIYQEVSEITAGMLEAARRGDWEELALLENECSSRIDALREKDASSPLTEIERRRKIDMIQRILDDDRQIRDIVTPWMAHLSGLINRSGTERKLNHAYGMNQSG